MEVLNKDKTRSANSKVETFFMPNESLEIVVIEDKKLINMIFGKTLHSAIDRIRNLKNFPIKFSSFQGCGDFISYLEKKEFGKSKIIVLSDNNLEHELNDTDILFNIKQKGIDLSMIVMSENSRDNSSGNRLKKEVRNIIPNQEIIQNASSQLIEKLVV